MFFVSQCYIVFLFFEFSTHSYGKTVRSSEQFRCRIYKHFELFLEKKRVVFLPVVFAKKTGLIDFFYRIFYFLRAINLSNAKRLEHATTSSSKLILQMTFPFMAFVYPILFTFQKLTLQFSWKNIWSLWRNKQSSHQCNWICNSVASILKTCGVSMTEWRDFSRKITRVLIGME